MNLFNVRLAAGITLASVALLACEHKSSNSKVKDQYSGSEFYTYTKEDRAATVNQLAEAMRTNYVSWGLKKQRLGVDGETVFAEAALLENARLDPTSVVDQARANLDFVDRLRAVLAKFRDSHLGLNVTNKVPPIFNGIYLREFEGKFTIVTAYPKILQYDDHLTHDLTLFKAVKPGMEVVKIDGKPVEDAIQDLLPYINSSTPEFTREIAVISLTSRSFRIPDKGYSDYTLLEPESGQTLTVRLPFYYRGTNLRKDADVLLDSLRIKPLNDLKMRWDALRQVWKFDVALQPEGYAYNPPNGLLDAKDYVSADENLEPVLRTGLILNEGRAYALLQVFSFNSDKVLAAATGSTPQEFIVPIAQFLMLAKSQGLPLILDLRDNPGGISTLPRDLLSLLLREGETTKDATSGMRVTRSARQSLERFSIGLPFAIDYISLLKSTELLNKAIAAKAEYTGLWSESSGITAEPAMKGFPNKIVALVSPWCVSACDLEAILLRNSGRAKIIGTQTNGTGSGFFGIQPYAPPVWTDNAQIASVQIPNFLFGKPIAGEDLVDESAEGLLKYNSENVPTVADIPYKATYAHDFETPDVGWIAKAIEVLNAPEPTPVPAPTETPAPK